MPTQPPNEVTKEAQKMVLEEWVRSQIISIPFLGLQIGHSDGAVLGSFGLFIIAIWFRLSMRRENETIGLLLRDSKSESPEIRKRIFHGVTSYLLFSSFGQGRNLITSINEDLCKDENSKYIKTMFRILTLMPVIAIGFIILTDLLSVFVLKAPLRLPHVPLGCHFDLKKWIIFIIIDGIALFFFFSTLKVCQKSYKCEEYTERILKEYETLIKSKTD